MITLYELKGAQDQRYSLFSWRARLALKHKGLEAVYHPICMTDKEAIAFSGGTTVPVLKDDDKVVRDSWKIAEYIEDAYPDRPSLFGGEVGRGLTRFVDLWTGRSIIPIVGPLIFVDIIARVDAQDMAYFRQRMEGAFGDSLENMAATREKGLVRLSEALGPARSLVKRQTYLSGSEPAYADYALFSVFQWARITSPISLLDKDDPLSDWLARMLGLFDGYAGAVPAAA